MPDLSIELIAWDRPGRAGALPVEDLDRVLGALADLHASGWPGGGRVGSGGFPWCPLPERLLLTSRPMCARPWPAGSPPASRRASGCWPGGTRSTGWRRPRRASWSRRLSADVTPLVAALGSPPGRRAARRSEAGERRTRAGRRVRFVDWSMTIVAPVALELGWFLVSNSGSLPEPPELVLERYRKAAGAAVVGDWRPRSTWRRSLACCCAGSGKASTPKRASRSRPACPAADDLGRGASGRSRRGHGALSAGRRCVSRARAKRTGGPWPQDDPGPFSRRMAPQPSQTTGERAA